VAPEILKNIPHDESVDMWSVGVIIYVLLVGYPPFLKDTQAELFQQIRTGDWKFFEKDWKDISEEAQELISGLLVVDPEQRWTVEDALRCTWIQQPEADLSTNDLSESLDMLRIRKSRLRKDMVIPVVWEHKEKSPVEAELQMQEPVRIASF
jgi:serine/threonine protein kinase